MFFDPLTAGITALLAHGVDALTTNKKSMPAEYWANKELMHKDRMSGVSEKQIMKNVEAGRYYIPKEITEGYQKIIREYPKPHRDPDSNKIIIENNALYRKDVREHGAVLAQKWLKEGKYNLNKKELEIAMAQIKLGYLNLVDDQTEKKEELKKIIESANWDYNKAEAYLQWQKIHDAETRYKEKHK